MHSTSTWETPHAARTRSAGHSAGAADGKDAPDLQHMRRRVAAAEAEAARLRRELEQAEWLADYDQAPEAQ